MVRPRQVDLERADGRRDKAGWGRGGRGGNHGEQAEHARRIRERHRLEELAAEREIRDSARERAGVGDQRINAPPQKAACLYNLNRVGPAQDDVAKDPEQVVAASDRRGHWKGRIDSTLRPARSIHSSP